MATILILGAADTGRAPMTAAILQQILAERSLPYQVASAGILGHDGDSPTGDAISTIDQMGLDINEHIARSLNAEIAADAALMIAVDSGTTRVARARFPAVAERIHTLGDLAGRARDIPDPFKMAMAAWLTYASEIAVMLRTALPRILTLLNDPSASAMPAFAVVAPVSTATQPSVPETTLAQPAQIPEAREAAIVRIQRLLNAIESMPAIIDWRAARSQLEADLDLCNEPVATTDLAPALVGLLRAALALTPQVPDTAQLMALREATKLLEHAVTQAELAAFSLRVGSWQ